MTSEPQPAAQQIRECMERILGSEPFVRSERQSRLLRHLVDCGLDGSEPDEQTVGVKAFDRREGYDTKTDPVVRVETARLRDRLRSYYEASGATDPLFIDIPQGAFRPVFRQRELTASASARLRRPLIAAAIAVVLVAAGVMWYRQREAEKASQARSVAVALADRAERFSRGLENMPVPEARRIAEAAVAADPTYARAHTMLSRVYYKILNERLVDDGVEEMRNKALAAAQEGIRLDPKYDLARSAETFIYSEIDFNLQKAAAACRNHIRAIPDSSRLLSQCSAIQSLLGNKELSLTWAKSGVSIDPDRLGAWFTLAMVQFRAGELKGLRESCDQIERRSPSNHGAAAYRAYSYALEGKYPQALALLRKGESPESLKSLTFLSQRGYLAARCNDKQVLDDTLNRIVAHKDHPNYTAERAIIASAQGNFDLLVEEIERHYLDGHIAYVHSLISNPFLAPVLKEPRVQVIVKKMRAYTE